MWAPTKTSDELYHHGILGQSWGHRNGPPYPLDAGDHSAKEKKAGYKKSIRREAKAQRKEQKKRSKAIYKAYKNNDKETAKGEISNSISEDQKKELKEKYNTWSKRFDAEEGFYNSKEKYEADERAYDDVYKWFEKNDPDYLDTIIKNNGGRKDNLDAFHDFRKVYEGTQDEYWDKAHDAYNKRKGIDGKSEKEAWDEYKAIQKAITKKVAGKYGKKKIKYGASDNVTIEEAVSLAISELTNKW